MEKINFKAAYAMVLTIQIINAIVTPIIMELGECTLPDGTVLPPDSDESCPYIPDEGIKKAWYAYSLSIGLIAN